MPLTVTPCLIALLVGVSDYERTSDLANTDDAVYVSTDGLQCRRVVPQVP